MTVTCQVQCLYRLGRIRDTLRHVTTKLRYRPGETQGSWVGRLVDAAGPSINQVADRADVPRETLSKIVNDKRPLTKAMAERLAPTLGISVDRLLLPREVEVESRRGLETRLESLAVDLAETVRTVAKLQERVLLLEARPWPNEGPSTGQAGSL